MTRKNPKRRNRDARRAKPARRHTTASKRVKPEIFDLEIVEALANVVDDIHEVALGVAHDLESLAASMRRHIANARAQ
jgi:hypothetical protein